MYGIFVLIYLNKIDTLRSCVPFNSVMLRAIINNIVKIGEDNAHTDR